MHSIRVVRGRAAGLLGDAAEALVPGGVPNLELRAAPGDVKGADLEVHADRADLKKRHVDNAQATAETVTVPRSWYDQIQ